MSLRDTFLNNPDRRYIMFGGKGGLGKTTFSAATAFWLASQGKRVLVFSVDPQASLSDIFQQDIFGKGPVHPSAGGKHLDGVVQSGGHPDAWKDPASAGFHASAANRRSRPRSSDTWSQTLISASSGV